MKKAEVNVIFTCDYCGEEVKITTKCKDWNDTLYDVWRYSSHTGLRGWVNFGSEHVCPQCWEKIQALKTHAKE